ncbi:MAG: hypothetical protein WC878_02625 [Candidatus Paceibacterota bacterium]|jgi:cytoskeletal protein CcmA (bactofilin family)
MKEKISHLRKHPKTPAILTALMFGGVSFAAVHNLPNPPLFPNTDTFVIFAEQSVSFEEGTTISSGDVGTNNTLNIGKDTAVNGNLFADKIEIAKGTTINGNASYNKINNKGEILGTKTKPVSLPIANLPTAQTFTVGTEDKTFSGNANTLPAGNYKNIILQKDSTLTLSGGTYNLNILDLREHSTLIFTAETTLNIQFKLRGRDNISILNGQNAKPNDLHINYVGTFPKQIKNEKQDDETEVMSFLDANEKADCKNRKIGRPIVFGKNAFLNFALIAPKANVIIGKDGTMRGQVLARKVRIERNGIVSKEETFERESDPTKIVEDNGEKFSGNELIVLFADSASFSDALSVAKSVNGTLSGFVPNPPTYKILLQTSDAVSVRNAVTVIINANNPLIEEVIPNYVSESE